MEKSESIKELSAALSKAQGCIKGAIKDSSNPFFKSQYADLSSIWEACREHLTKNNLAIIQAPEEAERGVCIETMLSHSSGEWITSKYIMPVSKSDAQAVGSAITYARRYALAAMVGIAPVDDDGNAAVKSPPPIEEKNINKNPVIKEEVKQEECSNEKFAENKGKWQEIIKTGKKTAKDLIITLSTKTTLTESQKQEIKSWEVAA